MELLDARRLTGPNLLLNSAGTIIDVCCTTAEADRLIPLWESHISAILQRLGWQFETLAYRQFKAGVSLAFSAPIDALYAATSINEWAFASCEAKINRTAAPDFDQQFDMIINAIKEEANEPLLALEAAAKLHNVELLWDDDHVSIGLGSGSTTWPCREIPDVSTINWSDYHNVPVGMVTGTNGKTTTVRMARQIMRAANLNVGISSTEWIAVNDRIIDRGDWSGPGGARQALRQQEVDVGILETARGGLLRRGLGVATVNAAVITNVSEDHLGDFASQSIDELLDIKWVVSRAVSTGGVLILNADDERLVYKSVNYSGAIAWFSLDANNPIIAEHTGAGGLAYVLQEDRLVRIKGNEYQNLCNSIDIPIVLGGAARHNIANALAAAALTEQLGAAPDDIRTGLISMSRDDNPGRANHYVVNDATVIVDFAHNPAAMRAVLDMSRAVPAKRRLLSFGQAGDRPDDLIRDLARHAWSIGLDAVNISELAHYHRGRNHGEVYTVIRDELLRCGAREDQIQYFEEETDALDAALHWAEPGDMIIMLALDSSTQIQQTLRAME